MSPKLTYRQLYQGLVNSTITVDTNGHDPFHGWGTKLLIEKLERKIEFDDKFKKGKVSKADTSCIDESGHVEELREVGNCCSKCGENYTWTLDNTETKLTCIGIKFNTNSILNFDITLNSSRCKEEFERPASFEFEVRETILFGNFFRHQMEVVKSSLTNEQQFVEYSLQHLAGRKKLTALYAKNNVGFQQTTNTSIEVYVNKERNELLIIEENYLNNDGTEIIAENELPKLGYTKVADISCDMWRYMFINKSDFNPDTDSDIDIEEVNLEEGKYLVHNYFDSSELGKHKIGQFDIAAIMKKTNSART